MLSELKSSCPSQPFSKWNERNKIVFLVQLGQILNNPFEPKLELKDLLKNQPEWLELVSNEVDPKKRKNYWNWMPPLERQAFELANTPEKKALIIQTKTKGLKKLALQMRDNDISQNLIVGSGPTGLIHALCFRMLGQGFNIIEMRNEEKIPRPNTVTLGKWDRRNWKFYCSLEQFTA